MERRPVELIPVPFPCRSLPADQARAANVASAASFAVRRNLITCRFV